MKIFFKKISRGFPAAFQVCCSPVRSCDRAGSGRIGTGDGNRSEHATAGGCSRAGMARNTPTHLHKNKKDSLTAHHRLNENTPHFAPSSTKPGDLEREARPRCSNTWP